MVPGARWARRSATATLLERKRAIHGGVMHRAKLWAIRDDGPVEGRKNEGEFYRQIVSRARTARERAAESLRRSGAVGKRQETSETSPTPLPSGVGFGARDDQAVCGGQRLGRVREPRARPEFRGR